MPPLALARSIPAGASSFGGPPAFGDLGPQRKAQGCDEGPLSCAGLARLRQIAVWQGGQRRAGRGALMLPRGTRTAAKSPKTLPVALPTGLLTSKPHRNGLI